jgi:hypothetical protein
MTARGEERIKPMKHIVLLAVMCVLVFGASAAPNETTTAHVSVVSAIS